MTEEKGEKKEEIQRIKKKYTRRKHRKQTLLQKVYQNMKNKENRIIIKNKSY